MNEEFEKLNELSTLELIKEEEGQCFGDQAIKESFEMTTLSRCCFCTKIFKI